MKYVLTKEKQNGIGFHKLHKESCKMKPKKDNSILLGECFCPMEALDKAKEIYNSVNGCKFCCPKLYYKIEIK